MKTIFISYVREDAASINAILNWQKQDKSLQIDFKTDRSLTELIENETKNNWTTSKIKDELRRAIGNSDGILILIGNDTHSHTWIERERSFAGENNLKVGFIRVSGSTGSAPKLVPNEKVKEFKLKSLKELISEWGW